MAKRISAIVLAAGESTCLGKPRLMLPIEARPMVRVVADALAAAKVSEVVVVVGAAADVVGAALEGSGARIVRNPRYAEGRGTSVHAGVSAADEGAEAYLIVPADMPLVDAALVDRLVDRLAKGREGILVPAYQRVPGYPLIFDRRYRDQLLALKPDDDLYVLLAENPRDVLDVHVVTDSVVFDVDDEEDYDALLRRLGLPGAAAPEEPAAVDTDAAM
jgi:molybdenum cofactor cytidylyltransferase